MESAVHMRSQLLRDMDNFSMAHSLELRAPFLAPRLFGAVFEMGANLKQRGNTIKPLLGAAAPRPFPPDILRQPKQGFGFPVEVWLRSGLERGFQEAMDAAAPSDIWNRASIDALWRGFRARQVHWSVLWNIFAFAKWMTAHHAHGQ